jgi:predicted RNA binding protein YcfA (HicA-like mRNA interferase family)
MPKQSKLHVERGSGTVIRTMVGRILTTNQRAKISQFLDRRSVAKRRVVIREGITFKEFKAVLKAHGFEVIPTTGKHKVYAEPKSGAMVVVPSYGDTDEVSAVHVRALRKLLSEKGLAK